METNNLDPKDDSRRIQTGPSGRVFGGLVLVIVGIVFLIRQVPGVDLPHWLFSWPMIMIAVGFYIGARHSFRIGGWMIVVLIGTVFLAEDIVYDLDIRHFLWPMIIISVGIFMILRPRGRRGRWDSPAASSEDLLDITSVFGGTKKNVISKEFKGGTITNMFGGTDLDLTQSDINGTVVLDISSIFGGTKLVVPGHWNLRTETATIFAGIEDKRHLTKDSIDMNKTLVLRGTCIFSGIDIKSH